MARTAIASLLVLASAALLLAGCSKDEGDQTPSACLSATSADYLSALRSAPGQVRLAGDTPISDCLTPSQDGGALAQVGSQMIAAATALNASARRDPTGPETVRLGYLVGAVERGAEGIHADLVRRLNTAARFSERGLQPADFERTFGEGYAAGRESG